MTEASGNLYGTIDSGNDHTWKTHIVPSDSALAVVVNAAVPEAAGFVLATAGFVGRCGWRRQIRPRHALARIVSRLVDRDIIDNSSATGPFVVPPAELLKSSADGAIDALPGDVLTEVAVYVRDCLQKSALSEGSEQSEHSISMAWKFAAEWTDCLASFLADVWDDDKFSDEAASQLTRWVAEEMLAFLTRRPLLHPIGDTMAVFDANAVLRTAIIHFASVQDAQRASTGLRILARAICLDTRDDSPSVGSADDVFRRGHLPPDIAYGNGAVVSCDTNQCYESLFC
jgi:hypothetical protein